MVLWRSRKHDQIRTPMQVLMQILILPPVFRVVQTSVPVRNTERCRSSAANVLPDPAEPAPGPSSTREHYG